MTAIEALPTAVAPPGRTVRVGRRSYPLVLPSARDPRLHLASVIITLQVLGQTLFHFDLSIAQILIAVVTSAGLDAVVIFVSKKVVAWPASAMLTGNGVAFVLRVPGTRHGDWWSLHGAWIFAAAAAVSLVSKYAIRWHGRHVFNPSNFGLLVCFLLLGSNRADPLDLWWARMGPALASALAVILVGGLVITRRTQMLGAAVAFWLTFAASVGVIAASGHCMTARWHVGPVCGEHFWFVLVTSPEILVFLFFMITDPRTAPAGRRARIVYGGLVAVVAAFLVAPQRTEFGTKVAVLGALAILCAFRPLLEHRFGHDAAQRSARPRRPIRIVAATVAIVAAAVPLLALAGSHARHAVVLVATVEPGTRRPEVAIDPAAIPPVRVDPEVRRIDASLTPTTARALVRDLLADFVIEADATRQRRAALAATAIVGPRYLALERAIATATPATEMVVTSYVLRTATIVLTRTTFQSGPQLAARVSGTLRREGYRGSTRTRVIADHVAFTRTFVFLHAGGHYLIATDQP
jgi:Na+-translocating ferredoxin:NAD+ oxidoreductase RnfD subunit